MNVLKEVYSKLKNNSSTLATDAVPSSPGKTNKDKETNGSGTPPPVPPRKKKNKPINIPEIPQLPSESSVNTQAIGSVINIVNSNDVHWGPEITYNIGQGENTETSVIEEVVKEESVEKTTDIMDLMESKDEIIHDHLNLVSEQLGSGWKNFLRSLGYKDGMIELTYESHHHKGIPEVIYQILLDWTRIEDRNLGELVTALWADAKFTVVRQLCNLINDKDVK